jgi:hypothetical protein
MSASDDELVERMAKRHSVSPAAVQVVMTALRSGGGRMAQFSHADFGGMSQWSPGMSMVGDMFNTQLKAKLDALCSDIAAHLDASGAAGGADLPRTKSATVQCRIGGLVAGRIGEAGRGGCSERSSIRGFSETRRLVIDDRGTVSLYDTGHHRIFGVAAQSGDRTLSFTSQDGLVRVADLPRVAV